MGVSSSLRVEEGKNIAMGAEIALMKSRGTVAEHYSTVVKR